MSGSHFSLIKLERGVEIYRLTNRTFVIFLLYFGKLHFFVCVCVKCNSLFRCLVEKIELPLARSHKRRAKKTFLSDSRCPSLNYIGGDNHLPCSTVPRDDAWRVLVDIVAWKGGFSLVKIVDSKSNVRCSNISGL